MMHGDFRLWAREIKNEKNTLSVSWYIKKKIVDSFEPMTPINLGLLEQQIIVVCLFS